MTFVLCWSTYDALIDALPGVGLHLGLAANLLMGMLVAAVVMMTAPVNGIQRVAMATQATIAAIAHISQRAAGADTVYGLCQFYEPTPVHM